MNTNHSLRDLLTPRYAYRHTFDEVVGWFEKEGFRVIDVQSSTAYRRLFNQTHFGIGMTGEKGKLTREAIRELSGDLPR